MQLQCTERASVGTNALCKSFGWDSAEMFQQQDVQVGSPNMVSFFFLSMIKRCFLSFLPCAGDDDGAVYVPGVFGRRAQRVHPHQVSFFYKKIRGAGFPFFVEKRKKGTGSWVVCIIENERCKQEKRNPMCVYLSSECQFHKRVNLEFLLLSVLHDAESSFF